MMPLPQFTAIIDRYSGRINYAAKRMLKDDHRALNVLFYTFSAVRENDITDEEIIYQIAVCEVHNEFWNLADTFKKKV